MHLANSFSFVGMGQSTPRRRLTPPASIKKLAIPSSLRAARSGKGQRHGSRQRRRMTVGLHNSAPIFTLARVRTISSGQFRLVPGQNQFQSC